MTSVQEDKHFKYGYIHALAASVPLIKSIVDHAGQEFDYEESIDVFKDIFQRVNDLTVQISRELAIDPKIPRQRTIYLSLLKHNAEVVSYLLEHDLNISKNKDQLVAEIESALKDNIQTWHQLPYIESVSGANTDQLTRLHACSFQVTSNLYRAVSDMPGGQEVAASVKILARFTREIVEEFTSEFGDSIEDEALGTIQSDLLLLVAQIVAKEWERYVRDYFRSGISPDRSRIRYMLTSFINALKNKPLGVQDIDVFVDEVIDYILEAASECVKNQAKGSTEYSDIYERYIISRCCIIASWMWEQVVNTAGDRIKQMEVSDDDRRKIESGQMPLVSASEFCHEIYVDIMSRINNGDYAVDMDDLNDILKQVVTTYLGISEFIHDMDISA